MNRIVITGATGMIGASLARIATDCGIKVLCIVRKGSSRLKNLPDSPLITVLLANLEEYRSITLPDRYDVFFHLAWDKTFGVSRDDVDIQVENVQFTLDAVRLAHRLGCNVFVGAGSQAEYGIVSEPLRGDTPVNPLSGYGIAKYAAGRLAKLLCNQIGMRYNWVRILSVYGPIDASHTLIMYTINELRKGHSPELTKCEQVWDYLYCDDAAEALLAIGERGVDGHVYPLGSGEKRTLLEYIEIIRNEISPNQPLSIGRKEYYPYQPMYLVADISELSNDTGWKPMRDFRNGIKQIIKVESTKT